MQADEIVVAQPDTSMMVVAAVGAAVIIGPAIAFSPGVWRIVFLAVAVILVVRVARMGVVVTPSAVVVTNYIGKHRFPLDEVKIIDERDQSPLLSDAGGKIDRTTRVLYLEDSEGNRVHVGMAPLVGSRLDQIAEDLYRAIDTMRGRH